MTSMPPERALAGGSPGFGTGQVSVLLVSYLEDSVPRDVLQKRPLSPAPCGPGGPELPCSPCGPCGPGRPGGPAGPVSPLGPVSPFGPAAPVSPLGPAGPVAPLAPGAPGAPAGPFWFQLIASSCDRQRGAEVELTLTL